MHTDWKKIVLQVAVLGAVLPATLLLAQLPSTAQAMENTQSEPPRLAAFLDSVRNVAAPLVNNPGQWGDPQCVLRGVINRVNNEDGCNKDKMRQDRSCFDTDTAEPGRCVLKYEKDPCYIGRRLAFWNIRHYFCDSGEQFSQPQCLNLGPADDRVINEDGCEAEKVHDPCTDSEGSYGECALKYERTSCFRRSTQTNVEVKHYFCEAGTEQPPSPQCDALPDIEKDGCTSENQNELCYDEDGSKGGGAGSCEVTNQEDVSCYAGTTPETWQVWTYECVPDDSLPPGTLEPQCSALTVHTGEDGCILSTEGSSCTDSDSGTSGICEVNREWKNCYKGTEFTSKWTTYSQCTPQEPVITPTPETDCTSTHLQCDDVNPTEEDGCTATTPPNTPCEDSNGGQAGFCFTDGAPLNCFNNCDPVETSTTYSRCEPDLCASDLTCIGKPPGDICSRNGTEGTCIPLSYHGCPTETLICEPTIANPTFLQRLNDWISTRAFFWR